MTLLRKIEDAKNILKNQKFPPLACIIFDIDGTLLDWDKSPILPVVDLYHLAGILNLKRFIITARIGTDDVIQATKKELEAVGIKDYEAIFFRTTLFDDPENMKISSRKKLKVMGYNCVMSIGDTYWDIGKYGGIGILLNDLPNNLIPKK